MKTDVQQALFSCDNGRLLCGAHLGHAARTTGRDISGQPVAQLTDSQRDALRELLAADPVCEVCAYLSRPEHR